MPNDHALAMVNVDRIGTWRPIRQCMVARVDQDGRAMPAKTRCHVPQNVLDMESADQTIAVLAWLDGQVEHVLVESRVLALRGI